MIQDVLSSPNVIIQVTNRAGEVTKQTLDKYGRTISITEGGTVVSTFDYKDRQGLVSSDARLKYSSYNNTENPNVVYSYDNNGNVTYIHDYYTDITYEKNNHVELIGSDVDQVVNVTTNEITHGSDENTRVTIKEEIRSALLKSNKNAQYIYIKHYIQNIILVILNIHKELIKMN